MMPIDALVSLIVTIALAALLYGPWQSLWVAVARQLIFERRAAIFDLAREGRLSFDSVEYRTIRRSLELSIRFAHELTWPRLLFVKAVMDHRGQAIPKSDLQSAVQRIADQKTRDVVEWHVFRAHLALVMMIFLRSPFLMLGLPLMLVAAVVVHYVLRARKWAKELLLRTGELIQIEAETSPSSQDELRPASALSC